MLSKNKIITVSTILLVTALISSIAKADNKMRPLEDAINQEQSPTMLVYAFERCSGLFASLYARFSNYQNDQMQQMAALHLRNSSVMSMGALVFAEKAGLNLTMDQTTKKSLSIARRYRDIMDDEYERTGNSISNFIEADLEICAAMVKMVNQ